MTGGQQDVRKPDIRAQALDKAMRLFWAKGAEGTSYADLVAATGLSRKALYAGWPDKDALVREALDCYRDTVLTRTMEPLRDGGAAGLAQFWDGLERAAMSPGFHGCFMVNSGTGPMAADPQIAARYGAHLDRLQAMLERAIRAGQAAGDVSADLDPAEAAALAVALAVQMQTMMAAGAHAARLPALFALARRTCGVAVRRAR